MGRTKATAKKTTGGPAKRAELPQFKKVSLNISTPHVIKSIFPKSTLSRKKPKPSIKSSHNTTMKTAAAFPKATLLREKPMPLSHNIYCFFCRDGGDLYDCSRCSRSVCDACVIVPAEFQARVKDSDVLFICAGCHEIRGKHSGDDGIRAYFGFEDIKGNPILGAPVTIHGHSEMTSRSQICSDPILILHFVLQTVDPLGSPAGVMREILRPYKPNDKLQYHEIMFDIGTMEKVEKHRLSMAKLVAELECLPIKFERVEVIVYSHSETTRGDIWGGFEDAEPVGRGRKKVIKQGEPIAYSIDDVS
ncbi:hypothetical protein DFJ58DRAFT_125776 [Suillus subalutaceus]|uniref:uncharacterized protein n=1 Tax=Suillus subalutaceus TaxID=48586 RepID=UPI001B8779B1|nr:uncharacterized protein DFJ58DRAFT_125776 [Suillus subalutaceus]KAG1838456.1 hypothetical protein DFJ58DRAFT_125776 [Suillus subalutaceus]